MRSDRIMTCSALAAAIMCGVGAMGQSVNINGTGLTAEYGAPVWVNGTNPTGFGDNNIGSIGDANGSEIDAFYARIGVDFFNQPMLFIGVSGNLETNFNKLEVFINTQDGVGQNPLRGDNPDIDFNGLNRMGENQDPNNGPVGPGLTFDSAFRVNYWVGVTTGNYDPNSGLAEVYANYCDLDNQTAYYLGKTTNGVGFLSDGTDPFGFLATIDNSNIAGVTDQTADPNAAQIVDTGWEIGIPMSALNNPTGDIRICCFINGSGHDVISSEVAGGHPFGAVNFGEPRTTDFTLAEGDQFVTIRQGGGGGYICTTSGTCPGQVTVNWSGAQPNKMHGLVFARGTGHLAIPPGNPCAGTALGLNGQGTMLVDPPGFISTGGNGAGQITGQAGAGACRGYVQWVTGGTCVISTVAQLP